MNAECCNAMFPRKIVIAFLIFWPLVDVLNGVIYYYDYSFFSVSALYKGVGFLFISVMLFFKREKRCLYIFAAFLMFLCFIYHYLVYSVTAESISWAIRAFLGIAIYYFFVAEESLNKKFFLFLSGWYLLVSGVNVLLGNIGIGEPQYSNGVGGKGFFIAGNELSFFMLASASIFLLSIVEKAVFLRLLLFVFALSLVFTLQGTKTTLGGFLCIVGFISIYLYAKPLNVLKGVGLIGVSLLAVVMAMKGPDWIGNFSIPVNKTSPSPISAAEKDVTTSLSVAEQDALPLISAAEQDATTPISAKEQNTPPLISATKAGVTDVPVVEQKPKPTVLDRWRYFAEKKGIAFLVLSGRSEFWNVAYDEKVSYFSPLDHVLGIGGEAFDIHRIEMDPLDIFVVYGILGLFVFYFLMYRMFYCSFRILRYSPMEGSLLLAVSLLFLLVSIMAGHVVNSGVSSSVLAIAALYYEKRRNESVMASV